MNYTVYILFSEKLNRYYTGATSNIDVRMDFHENAENHKYTHKADDWQIVFTLECENKSQMLSIEKHIKSMKSKVYIQNLIQYPEMAAKLKIQYPG
ncbi:GIY-YIG nuclease family protein [Flavobacterium sp. AG291]|uniref:GIY-YIG nuclease family protein n=1 Tax=Flavobacterium sp. AG291 TaxID=2184000 RepID=UPI000E0BF3F9|nr:GIY-YIG nuclease family protein [Flavobacterium sp. AG291]RDI08549.1 putative endonuclease [Flavobacterium sp. AG291]